MHNDYLRLRCEIRVLNALFSDETDREMTEKEYLSFMHVMGVLAAFVVAFLAVNSAITSLISFLA